MQFVLSLPLETLHEYILNKLNSNPKTFFFKILNEDFQLGQMVLFLFPSWRHSAANFLRENIRQKCNNDSFLYHVHVCYFGTVLPGLSASCWLSHIASHIAILPWDYQLLGASLQTKPLYLILQCAFWRLLETPDATLQILFFKGAHVKILPPTHHVKI